MKTELKLPADYLDSLHITFTSQERMKILNTMRQFAEQCVNEEKNETDKKMVDFLIWTRQYSQTNNHSAQELLQIYSDIQ